MRYNIPSTKTSFGRRMIMLLMLLMLGNLSSSFTTASTTTTSCMDPGDRVTHLPGLNQPLPSPWYSGYLSYEFHGHTIHTHYVLVEVEDLGDSSTTTNSKPLIYWTNGGPGASSLFGLMTELGPLLFSDESIQGQGNNDEIPKPIYNPNSWTRLGTLLIMDQPAPIGFSYCDDDIMGRNCLPWTDELAAANTYAALRAFFTKYPCYQELDLYLTGESYGGIYVPTLAREILQDTTSSPLNLKGFAVGDGCLGTETGLCPDLGGTTGVDVWRIVFLFGHGQIPIRTFQQFIQTCNPHQTTDWKLQSPNDPECQKVIQEINEQAGGYYEYHLYDECTYRNGILTGAVNDYACGGDLVLEAYFQHPEVLEAFHVPNNYYSVDNAVGFDYTPTEKDLRPFYQSLTTKNQDDPDSQIRVLIYNGDADPAITSLAAQNWTWHLDLPEQQSWRPWTVDGCRRVGGYVTRYEGGLDFLTIRGAGHMVPTYKSDATFTFMSAWIKGEDYPVYDKDCIRPDLYQSEETILVQPE